MTISIPMDATNIGGTAKRTPALWTAGMSVVFAYCGVADAATSNSYQRPISPEVTTSTPVAYATVGVELRSETAAESLLEIRRLSGLTWEELADLFDVSRRSVHNWASGKPVSAEHERSIRNMLSVVRRVDQGGQERTRALLLTSDNPDAPSLYDLLKQGNFELAKDRAEAAPKVGRTQLRPLSVYEQQQRRPLKPAQLMEGIVDRPKVEVTARPSRFSPMPRARSKSS